jgi:hypothetical protein
MRTVGLLAILICIVTAPNLSGQEAGKSHLSWAAPPTRDNVICIDESYGVPEAFRKSLPSGLKTISDLTAAVHQVTGFSVTFTPWSESGKPLSPKSPLKVPVDGLRVFEALDRLDDEPQPVGWRIGENEVALYQYDLGACDSLMMTLVVHDITNLRNHGLERSIIIRSIQDYSGGAWEEVDGAGGTITSLGPSLLIRADRRDQRGVRPVLEMLGSDQREVYLRQPSTLIDTLQTLDRLVSLDVSDATPADIRRELDRLSNGCIQWPKDPEAIASWESMNFRTRHFVNCRLSDVLAAFDIEDLIDGRLSPHSEGKRSVIHVQFNVGSLTRGDQRKMDLLVGLLPEQCSEPWDEFDGEGGSMDPVTADHLIVRQTFVGVCEVREALRRLEPLFMKLPANLDDSSPEASDVLEDIRAFKKPQPSGGGFF